MWRTETQKDKVTCSKIRRNFMTEQKLKPVFMSPQWVLLCLLLSQHAVKKIKFDCVRTYSSVEPECGMNGGPHATFISVSVLCSLLASLGTSQIFFWQVENIMAKCWCSLTLSLISGWDSVSSHGGGRKRPKSSYVSSYTCNPSKSDTCYKLWVLP